MKTVLQVNLGNLSSTGGIARGITKVLNEQGGRGICAYPWHRGNRPSEEGDIHIGSKWGRRISTRLGLITGLNNCFSAIATANLLKKLTDMHVDILHLHNLHNGYINLPMLFRYIKKNNIPVVWTLHDCWAFTGHCPYFDIAKCEKWKTGCYDCPQYRLYPESWIDNSKFMYKWKKKWFTGVENMTLVTPSRWLADLVKQSFLKEYPVKVIHNGIDLSVFKPTESDFRKRYGCEDKFIVLGVAFGWGVRKGLDVFVELSKRLSDKYQVVLVGTDDNVDKMLPKGIISIHRTQNQKELGEIYTAADVFVNPTREDNFPTVNIEALACGTPVVTFRTGGSPEIPDESCGGVVAQGDIVALKKAVEEVCCIKAYAEDACCRRAKELDQNVKFQEYVDLYQAIIKNENKGNT